MRKYILLLFILLLLAGKSYTQTKYWIFLDSKSVAEPGKKYVSDRTIKNRQMLFLPKEQWTDLPVNTKYINDLTALGIKVVCYSKWLNSVSAHLTIDQVQTIKKLDFVVDVTPIRGFLYYTSLNDPDNSNPWEWAFNELNGKLIVEKNLTAKNVAIGVIDGGFKGAHESELLQRVINNKNVLIMKDFVNPSVTSLFEAQHPDLSEHGKYVLEMVAGYNKKEDIHYGLATDATFYLAKTENNFSEFRGEQDYWIEGIEWLDSLGVRLVNSSLGYSYDFDDPSENYTPDDMNGTTSEISRAAQIAVSEKGMIVVTSIGNEGGEEWQVITTPSDAKGVIAVGTADIEHWTKPYFSSIGPEGLSYLKPNITCPSADGTSFSAPFITGLIACLLEKEPDLTTADVKEIVEKSGHLYPYGNNYMGYGVPTAERILKLMENRNHKFNRASEIIVKSDSVLIDLKKIRTEPDEVLTLFFKTDKHIVSQQAISDKESILLKRKEHIDRVTIASKNKVVEVIWD